MPTKEDLIDKDNNELRAFREAAGLDTLEALGLISEEEVEYYENLEYVLS